MSSTLVEAFDLLTAAEQLELRLASVAEELAQRAEMRAEAGWLHDARKRLAPVCAGAAIGDLLNRALALPELDAVKGERARSLQSAAVDAVIDLQPAIASAGGARSPVIEAVFRNLKPLTMRRAAQPAFEAFCAEVERRLASTYVQRMLANDDYAPAAPAVERVRCTFRDWRRAFSTEPLGEEEHAALRGELEHAASRLMMPYRQAQLLARAALLPDEALLSASGVLDKPKRRSTPALPVAPSAS